MIFLTYDTFITVIQINHGFTKVQRDEQGHSIVRSTVLLPLDTQVAIIMKCMHIHDFHFDQPLCIS